MLRHCFRAALTRLGAAQFLLYAISQMTEANSGSHFSTGCRPQRPFLLLLLQGAIPLCCSSLPTPLAVTGRPGWRRDAGLTSMSLASTRGHSFITVPRLSNDLREAFLLGRGLHGARWRSACRPGGTRTAAPRFRRTARRTRPSAADAPARFHCGCLGSTAFLVESVSLLHLRSESQVLLPPADCFLGDSGTFFSQCPDAVHVRAPAVLPFVMAQWAAEVRSVKVSRQIGSKLHALALGTDIQAVRAENRPRPWQSLRYNWFL